MRDQLDITGSRQAALLREPTGGGELLFRRSTVEGKPVQPRGFSFSVTALTAGGLILPVDLNRGLLLIVNYSATNVVWIAFNVPAQAGRGHRLATNGGGLFFDFNCPTAPIYALAIGANNPDIVITTG